MNRKKITIISIIAGFILLAIAGVIVGRNLIYKKNAKDCQLVIQKLYFASSMAASRIHDNWMEYIFDDKHYIDLNNGKMYKFPYSSYNFPEGHHSAYCYDITDVVQETSDYLDDLTVTDTIKNLYYTSKRLMTKMTPAPSRYRTVNYNITQLFHAVEELYDCAVSPDGNLESYTKSINSSSSDYKKYSSQVEIEFGDADPVELTTFLFTIQLMFSMELPNRE